MNASEAFLSEAAAEISTAFVLAPVEADSVTLVACPGIQVTTTVRSRTEGSTATLASIIVLATMQS